MAVRVKCKCGKLLNVPSKLADKKIACPGCKMPFRIPLAKFQAAGQAPAAAPSTARPSLPAPSLAPAAPNTPSMQLDPEIADLSGIIGLSSSGAFGELELEGSPAAATTPAPCAIDIGDPVDLPYARENAASAVLPSPRRISAAIEGPRRTYWSNAIGSFIYPVRNGGNIANFIVIAIIALFAIPLGFVGFYGLFGIFIIFGWVRAMYLSVVQDTASGSDDMPGVKMEDGFLDDIIKPAFKYIGSYAVALLPAIAYTLGMAGGLIPASMKSEYVLAAWIAGGLFIWPIFLMLFAFGALDMIYRVDLIFATIFRTLGPYLSLWGMLLLVSLLSMLPSLNGIFSALSIPIAVPSLPDYGLATEALYKVLDVYFSIVTMRLIGLYYLHFKRRFAIVLE